MLGGLMFAAAGALILAALDQVPHHLVDNAAALGVISLITALLFFTDFALASKRRKRYKTPPSPPPIIRTNNATQTLDPKSYIGPMFVTRTETPIHRFHSSNHTTPKWVGDESDGEFVTQNPNVGVEGMNQHPPPPPGFMHDTPTRGFVLRTAQNWPKTGGPKANPVIRTMSDESRETFDDEMNYQPHTVEVTTETPRSVINTRVLHRWLNQKRDRNGTNNLI